MENSDAVELTAELVRRLHPVRCAIPNEPWTKEAEELAGDVVAGTVLDDDPRVTALGFVDEPQVQSLVGWHQLGDLPIWHVEVLATDQGSQRQGLGERLLREVLRRAGDDGMESLFARVRPGNEPMRRLIEKLGGDMVEPDEDRQHLVATIPVPR